ncbi:hypothetical protein [Roseivivax marinus]|uniref:hypothetical protein n=1 Tax=Roseivivax marinus TaxID=1379903 RepID=UPI00273F0AF8|nr:hypothetical protein [Roseivivax marinus]
MPAAQPSQSRVENVIGAIVAAGLQPAAVHVNADGSFRVEVAGIQASLPQGKPSMKTTSPHGAGNDALPGWEDGTSET